jgi:hypothetical protein
VGEEGLVFVVDDAGVMAGLVDDEVRGCSVCFDPFGGGNRDGVRAGEVALTEVAGEGEKEDFEGVVGGAVVEAEKDEVLGPVFDFLEPLEHDFADGGLLVEDGENDGEIGGHFGEVERIGRSGWIRLGRAMERKETGSSGESGWRVGERL